MSDDGLDDMKAGIAVVITEIFAGFLVFFALKIHFETKFDFPTWVGVCFAIAVTAVNFRLIYPNARSLSQAKLADSCISRWSATKRSIVYGLAYVIPFLVVGCSIYLGQLVGKASKGL